MSERGLDVELGSRRSSAAPEMRGRIDVGRNNKFERYGGKCLKRENEKRRGRRHIGAGGHHLLAEWTMLLIVRRRRLLLGRPSIGRRDVRQTGRGRDQKLAVDMGLSDKALH